MNHITTKLAAHWAHLNPDTTAKAPRSRPPQIKRRTSCKSNRRVATPAPRPAAGQVPPPAPVDLDIQILTLVTQLDSLAMQHPRAIELEVLMEKVRRTLRW